MSSALTPPCRPPKPEGPGGSRRLSTQQDAELYARRRAGWSLRELATHYRITKPGVAYILRQMGGDPRPFVRPGAAR